MAKYGWKTSAADRQRQDGNDVPFPTHIRHTAQTERHTSFGLNRRPDIPQVSLMMECCGCQLDSLASLADTMS